MMTAWQCTYVREDDGRLTIYRLVDGSPADRWDQKTKAWMPIEENE